MAIKLSPVSIRRTPYNEAWVQSLIADDPTQLGLGDLQLLDRERRQASGGRLDLLLVDVESDVPHRYEVELQLGATDESHLVRTLEYWDIERKRYPQYDHTAVIVAEEITSRFLNVIQLFNGHIPLIAIKMTCYEIDGQHALTFVKVLDAMRLGPVDADEPVAAVTDRDYWEKAVGPSSMKLMDELFTIAKEVVPEATPNYVKNYVGVSVMGVARNFIAIKPKKKFAVMCFKLQKEDEINDALNNSALDVMPYDVVFSEYRIRLKSYPEDETELTLLRDLARRAADTYRGGVLT